jgi:hypothetical protein
MRTWIKRSAVLAVTAVFISAGVAPASAHDNGAAFGAGVAAGILGLGVLGAMEADRERDYYSNYGPSCRPGPLECRTYGAPCFHDEYGAYICPPPERHCFRRPICD